MQKKIDLRSDTVTQPTMRMRDAMRNAVVGDDVLGEDPTTKQLEELAAGILGKEAGLFLSSGTMANQVAVLTMTKSGDQIIVHEDSHIYNLEVGGLSANLWGSNQAFSVCKWVLFLEAIKRQVHFPSIQQARTSLLCLENTHDLNRGLVIPAAHLIEVSEAVREMGLSVYLDGARIFNAAVASGEDPAEISRSSDMVGFCLTKGLACPVGSLLVGPKDLIKESRRMRQRLGGGWRQSGILAAARNNRTGGDDCTDLKKITRELPIWPEQLLCLGLNRHMVGTDQHY